MEAAVVSGILKIVSNKLAPLLIKEYSLIVGVQKHLLELKDQVQEINYWLEAVGDKVSPDTPAFNWLRKLKDIAYDVDDIVDEFQLKAEEHDAHGAAGVVSRYMCEIPKSLILQCKAANKLKAVKKRFDAIVKQRTEFNAIANSLPAGHPTRDMSQTSANQTTLPTVDVASVLGRDREKHQIISKLVDDKHIIKTISIIGLGGSGKTTLAKLVFNDCSIVEKHFEVRLWVHVSQEFDVYKLIKKLFEAFADNNPGQHALPYMIKTISEKLTGKRVLLVLDDVWTESLIQWENYTVHLKSCAPGSRILLTARSRRVAETVQSTDQFDLPFLSLDDSWQLFQQSLVMPAEGLGSEFVNVGKEIVKKCGGVPLAIKALAGVLNGMEQIQEWESMRDSNVLDVEGKEHIVSACLRLSYLNLPSHLKQCFTICSLFPKGHSIDKEQLIDLWIAHDMITVEDPFDYLNLEYVGHKHFNSLLEVSFLQNIEEKDGRVTCGMHDLVHDLALSIMGDEISFDMPNEATSSTTKSYRYFSLIERTENLVPKNFFRRARAIYMPEDADYIYGMALKHAKHLRSVIVGGYLNEKVANIISQVRYLKYLTISNLCCGTLPETISDVWSLQALHVIESDSLQELPQSVGKLKKLRTLRLTHCSYLKSLPESIGDCQMISNIDLCSSKLTVLPDSIGKLQKLRTLNLAWCFELKCLPDSIGDCQMISSIDLSNCSELTVLPDSIGKLKKLSALNLSSCNKLKCLPDSIGDCQMISSIDLSYCSELAVFPDSVGKLQKLSALNLSCCGELKRLPDSIGDCQMISSIALSHCTKLTVLPDFIGKLQKLSALNLSCCGELKRLPDSIGDCQMISSIDLSHCCELTVLPDSIGKLQKLSALNLSWCGELKRLPDSIGDCQMISSIDLSHCWELTVLPDSVGKLQKLSALNLTECVELKCLPELHEGIGNLEKLQVLNLKGCNELGGMPIGIGQLSQLQKLDLFIVGMGKKFAGISELANISGIGEQLTIRGISHVMDPNDAHMACLKQKTKLQRLNLEWMANDTKEVNTKLEQDVLDGLQPPPGIKELSIHGYSGRHYARWMLNQVTGGVQSTAPFPFLRVLRLYDFPNLKNLHGLVELPCLEKLKLKRMPSIESISGGPFPSLVKLVMRELPRLGEVWIVPERTMPDVEDGEGCYNYNLTPHLGQVRVGSCLTELKIMGCPELEVMPRLPPSLQQLKLLGSEKVLQSPGQWQGSSSSPSFIELKKLKLRAVTGLGSRHGWELLQHMIALESLKIIGFSGVETELPRSLWSLTSLRSLQVELCPNIRMLPESLGELRSLQELTIQGCHSLTSLPLTMGQLTSLQTLEIGYCGALRHLSDCRGELCSLRELKITNLPELTCLPQFICCLTISLQALYIIFCPGIKSLPEWIKDLTALKRLYIWGCPELKRRCEREKGEDWHLISHIPNVDIRGVAMRG